MSAVLWRSWQSVGGGSAAQGGAGSSPAVELGPTGKVAQLNTRVEGEVAQLGRKIGMLVVGHGLWRAAFAVARALMASATGGIAAHSVHGSI